MPPKGKKINPVKPPSTPPVLVKTHGAFSLQTAPDDVKLALFRVIKEEKGLSAPHGKNQTIAKAIVSKLYGERGLLVEYQEPGNPTLWLGRCISFLEASFDALQTKTHGADDSVEEESDFEKFVNKNYPQTKKGKKRKKSRETKKDNKTVKRILDLRRRRRMSNRATPTPPPPPPPPPPTAPPPTTTMR